MDRLAIKIAQWLLDGALWFSLRGGPILRLLVWQARARLVSALGASNILVLYNLHGHDITIPACSDLPAVLARHPLYGENLGRIASLVDEFYGGAPAIDIGANVGDTAITIRKSTLGPLLCVEGSPMFYKLCVRNIAGLADTEIERAFVDMSSHNLSGSITEQAGSSQIIPRREGPEIQMRSLDDILRDHPRFIGSKLVKIDTDGYDARIVLGALQWIADNLPVLFWECDPKADDGVGGPGLTVFQELAAAGYGWFIFFANTGEYLATCDALDGPAIKNVYYSLSGRRGHPHYADVCAIPRIAEPLVGRLQSVYVS